MDARGRAIERVYRTRYLAFRNALATVTGDRDSARDAVQDGFAQALAGRKALRDEDALEAWIWRIALRAALRIRARNDGVELHEALDPRLPEPVLDPGLADAVRTLPPKRRLIFFLRHFADLPYDEIAAICEVSEGTVAAALSDARAQLRRELEPTRAGETPSRPVEGAAHG